MVYLIVVAIVLNSWLEAGYSGSQAAQAEDWKSRGSGACNLS